VDVLSYLAGVHLLERSYGLADPLVNTLKQLAGEGSLFDLITLHHIGLNSLHNFLLAFLVHLLGLLNLG
jgi:hypothetical protein